MNTYFLEKYIFQNIHKNGKKRLHLTCWNRSFYISQFISDWSNSIRWDEIIPVCRVPQKLKIFSLLIIYNRIIQYLVENTSGRRNVKLWMKFVKPSTVNFVFFCWTYFISWSRNHWFNWIRCGKNWFRINFE